MPSEPITVFSRMIKPVEVLAEIRGRFPHATISGSQGDWKEITIPFDSARGTQTLTFIHNTSYYKGPDWAVQMEGMRGYFDRFPGETNLKAQVHDLIGTFHFALATRFEPDYDDPSSDERFAVVRGVTHLLDGVIFTPSGLRDADGRLLLGAGGESDPEARWPAVRAEAPAVPDGVLEAGPDGADPPTPLQVACRALALMGVTARAVIEREIRGKKVPEQEAAHMQRTLAEWLVDMGVEGEFEPAEQAVVLAKPGLLGDQRFLDSMWRIEGLAVLAWALRRSALPRYDTLADIDSVWGSLGFLKPAESKELLESAELRPAEELDAYRRQILGFHWRLRQFVVDPTTMNFRAFAAKSWFGSFDVSAFDLVDDDLAFRGERIDRLDAKTRGTAMSIARERHHAINWLIFGPRTYSKTYVGT